MKLGEKLMFGFAVLVAVAAIGKGVRQFGDTEPAKPRNYYEWDEAGLEGHVLYRRMGCNSCHRALGVGEIGVAPVLDGEGTRRTREWLAEYFQDPAPWCRAPPTTAASDRISVRYAPASAPCWSLFWPA